MRKIYINEGFLSNLVKGRILPKFLFKLVKTHTTSLGDNAVFPTSDDYPFDYVLLKKRYNEVCSAIDEIGLNSLDEDSLVSELSSLVTKCKKLEQPIRDSLERICENALNKLFAIPPETINMSFKLVDKIKFKNAIRMRPESNDEVKYTFNDIADIDLSNKAIAKRRLINSLIQGAAYTYGCVEGLYADDIDRINPELLKLYKEIRVINDYLLFIKKEEMTDDKPMQGSYVETKLGMGNDKTEINVQGIIFPLLFQESIKGLFELFSAHGLPHDMNKAQYIVKKSDFILAEPWDLRLGVGLWNMIFGNVEDTNMIPYMFTSLVKMPTDEFNASVKEILSNTKKGKSILNALVKNAEYDNGYQQFTNRINAKNVDKSLINDSYFTAGETNGYELDSEDNTDDVIEEDDMTELSHNTYQDAAKNAFENDYDNRVRKFRKAAEQAYNSDNNRTYVGYDYTTDEYSKDGRWITLNSGKKLVIFDDEYKCLNDLYNGVKKGKLLIHARKMTGEISDDLRYIYPCFDETLMTFYGAEYDEVARSKSEYYGEEIEPEYPELIFASDNFSWCENTRNGVFFIESDGFQKSLGDGMIQLPNGEICKYWEGGVYDYDSEVFMDEPICCEYGDWYSSQYATVVAVMNVEKLQNENTQNNRNIITESQESKSISQAKRLVMQRLNYNEQEADEFIRVKLRNDIPILRTPSGGKFILGAARMFCDGELRTANDIGTKTLCKGLRRQ